MIDIAVKKKIQYTRLFSDNEKIELLVRLDELSDSDLRVLEETIDGFDAQYFTSVGVLTDAINKGITVLDRDLSTEEKTQMGEAALAVNVGLGYL